MEKLTVWKLLIAEAAKAIAKNIGGFYGWAAGLVAKYGGQALLDLFNVWYAKMVRKGVQEEAKDKYEEIINDPTKTPDDRGKAYEDMINAGRKK